MKSGREYGIESVVNTWNRGFIRIYVVKGIVKSPKYLSKCVTTPSPNSHLKSNSWVQCDRRCLLTNIDKSSKSTIR